MEARVHSRFEFQHCCGKKKGDLETICRTLPWFLFLSVVNYKCYPHHGLFLLFELLRPFIKNQLTQSFVCLAWLQGDVGNWTILNIQCNTLAFLGPPCFGKRGQWGHPSPPKKCWHLNPILCVCGGGGSAQTPTWRYQLPFSGGCNKQFQISWLFTITSVLSSGKVIFHFSFL